MPRWLKITFRILLGCALLAALLWIVLVVYIQTHKQQILNRITTQVNEHIHGRLTIGDIEPSLWRGFPGISVVLKHVSLRDSLWERHHHSLLEARNIFVKFNSFRVFSRQPEIDKVTLQDAEVYLFTDSTGYSNTYLLQKKDSTAPNRSGRFSFETFALDQVRFVLENKVKFKLFDITVKKLDGKAQRHNGIWHIALNTKADIHEFCFNTEKGSYLKNAALYADLRLLYDTKKKLLTIADQPVCINSQNLFTAGHFDFSSKPAAFDLRLRSDKAWYSHIVPLLSPNISSKLDSISLERPVKLSAQISGFLRFRDTPLVHVAWEVAGNTLSTPAGDFSECGFTGYYSNEAARGKGHNDPNSMIVLRKVSARWNSIPFRADTVCITNLLKPLLVFNLHTDAPLTSLNNAAAKMPFEFKTGRLLLDMHYDGPLSKKTDSTIMPNIIARGAIRDAAFTYLPRSLSFTHTNALLELDGDNLTFRDMVMQKEHSVLHMEGTALHIFRFYFDDPQKVLIDWHIRSPLVNLGDFLSFVGKRKRNAAAAGQTAQRNKATQIFSQLDKVLDAADVNIELDVDRLYFRRFVADHVSLRAAMTSTDIVLSDVHAIHSGGNILLNARISQSARNNPFTVTADIRNVAVDKIFYAFENFGQEAIEAKNVRGNLTAKATVSGQMTEGGKIINQSLYGNIDYTLHNGALINFEPMLKINKFFFRKRDFSNIQIQDLTGKLELQGKKIIIPPLHIVSSALYLNVAGVYAPPDGTSIQLELPLRNPKKDEQAADNANSIVLPARKGIVLYLRAQDGPDGKVKIGWDPMKKTVIPAKEFGRKRRIRDSLRHL